MKGKESKAWKIQTSTEIQTNELCDIGAVLFQLHYQVSLQYTRLGWIIIYILDIKQK